jgi:uncharacterized protein
VIRASKGHDAEPTGSISRDATSGSVAQRSVGRFVALVLAGSAAFWALGPLIGAATRWTGADLPGSALMFLCPGLSAIVLVRRAGDDVGEFVRQLRGWPDRAHLAWYLPMVLLLPLELLGSYVIMQRLGLALPRHAHVRWAALPGLSVIYLVAAAGEELGWSAYATAPLQRRHGALTAALILGAIWAALHVIPYFQAGHDAAWVMWQCVFTIGLRIVLVWLYNNTRGCVTAPIVCHASYNVAWSLFPNSGSFYNPAITAAVMTIVAAAVVVAWGPSTLTRPPARQHARVSMR